MKLIAKTLRIEERADLQLRDWEEPVRKLCRQIYADINIRKMRGRKGENMNPNKA